MAVFLRNGLFISEVVADNIGGGGIDTDGDGGVNKADEFVEIQNGGYGTADLTGIQLWSATNGLLYSFGANSVEAGSVATVIGEYSGALPPGFYESSTNNNINFLPDGEGNKRDTLFLVDTLNNEYVALSYGLPPTFALPTGFPGGYTSLGNEAITTGVPNGTSILRDIAGALTTNTSPTPATEGFDGIVHGTSGNNSIGTGFTDGGGDSIDGNDASRATEVGDDDIIVAGAGDDTAFGNAANDEIFGGSGADTLIGNAGNDSLFGGSGDDVIVTGNDNGAFAGSDDTSANANYAEGGDGIDTIFGSDAMDSLYGGQGEDTLYGGDGNDQLFGGVGNDIVYGGGGADQISTGDDKDIIFGGIGDTVDGGEGGSDSDRLDVTGEGPARVVYSTTNPEDGTIEFLDVNRNVIGTLAFSNIETIDYVPCFTAGTLIETQKDTKPVECLEPGDLVKTRDHGAQPVRWIGTRCLKAEDLRQKPMLAPIVIQAGALGHDLPAQDLIVSPQHRLLVAEPRCQLYFDDAEMLAPALSLLHLDGVKQRHWADVTYVHVMFDQHELICAYGCWSEGFQPGAAVLNDMTADQKSELFTLFPELEKRPDAMVAARPTLKAYESALVA